MEPGIWYRDVQRPLSFARWVAVIAATAAVLLNDSWADGTSQQMAWALVAIVSIGSLLIWGWGRGSGSDADGGRIIAIGFLLDVVLVLGMAWVFVPDPYVTVTLVLLALSGALRYGWAGAWTASVLTAVFGVAIFVRIADLTGGTFDRASYALVLGITVTVACIAAAIAANWHRRRADFERQAARMVELDTLKDRYIAITSHEIRGPVATMISAVDTVRSRWDKLDPDRRDHLLEMVQLQGRELDRLVQDLFISAEVQGGGLTLQPEWVELDTTIKRAVEAAAGKRRAHLLELFVDPLRAEVDPHRVGQIVRNLVENAYKYTPDRTRVVVTAKGVDGGMIIEVRDDGEGIPAAKRDKLFEAFTRIAETSAGQEGVGLGLFVVSQLVAAMNGRIDLQSSTRGTTFSIFIPCNTTSGETPRIGLVDDEASHG